MIPDGLATFLLPARDRRKALHSVLFELLELRVEIKASDPELFWAAISQLVVDRFGARSVRELLQAGVQEFVRRGVFRAIEIRSTAYATTYQAALRSVIPFEPLLARDLDDGDSMYVLERALTSYWARVQAQPRLQIDTRVRAIIVGPDGGMTVPIQLALATLTSTTNKIARAAGLRTAWRTRQALKLQDEISASALQLRISRWLGRISPSPPFDVRQIACRPGSAPRA